ncbi:MerR family transcriptional regulator [Roseateles sp. NT4]|uniref:MerR family transcriptional regulator n=1 Tax=Roseateles sp. NT4 TaxID=3453715 RepID=UPI003EEA3258
MKIGELATRTGLAPSAIRFYESQGLLPPARRAGNGYRVYGEDAVQRLQIVTLSQSFGLSLDSLRTVFDMQQGFSKAMMLSRLGERLGEIDALIRGLQVQRQELREVHDTLRDHWAAGRCVAPASLARPGARRNTNRLLPGTASDDDTKDPAVRRQRARGHTAA